MGFMINKNLTANDYLRSIYPDIPEAWDVFAFECIDGVVELHGAVPEINEGELKYEKDLRVYRIALSTMPSDRRE